MIGMLQIECANLPADFLTQMQTTVIKYAFKKNFLLSKINFDFWGKTSGIRTIDMV